MPIADVLRVVDRHDVPNVAPVDDFADFHAGWKVAHHVADRQNDVILRAGLQDYRKCLSPV